MQKNAIVIFPVTEMITTENYSLDRLKNHMSNRSVKKLGFELSDLGIFYLESVEKAHVNNRIKLNNF